MLGKQLEDYEALLAQVEELAPALYKAQWLEPNGIDRSKFAEYLQTHDLDIDASDQALKSLVDFLREWAESGLKLKKDSEMFKTYSTDFQERYAKAYPDDTSLNSGKNRGPWQERAINNHLKT